MTPKPIYLYQCPNNHVDYGWEDKGDYPQCPECDSRMNRMEQQKTNKDKREIKRLMDFEIAVLELLELWGPIPEFPDFAASVREALNRLEVSRKADS